MDTRTARALAALDNRFYNAHVASFSQTRNAPWDGWGRCLDAATEPAAGAPPRVLDVAAGNLRFERFLAARTGWANAQVLALDACSELAGPALMDLPRTSFRRADVLDALFSARESETPFSLIPACDGNHSFDFVACFGFMHHVPGSGARADLLRALLQTVQPGGTAAVSFWQLEKSKRLVRKAREATEAARHDPELAHIVSALEHGDWLLGWQGAADAYRYAHSFSDTEVDALAHGVRDLAQVVERFSADGAPEPLNAYLVLRRNG